MAAPPRKHSTAKSKNTLESLQTEESVLTHMQWKRLPCRAISKQWGDSISGIRIVFFCCDFGACLLFVPRASSASVSLTRALNKQKAHRNNGQKRKGQSERLKAQSLPLLHRFVAIGSNEKTFLTYSQIKSLSLWWRDIHSFTFYCCYQMLGIGCAQRRAIMQL